MKLTQYETDAMQSLIDHATDSQEFCIGVQGVPMTSSELRTTIRKANRMFDLRPAILEQVARQVESTVGVRMGLEQT